MLELKGVATLSTLTQLWTLPLRWEWCYWLLNALLIQYCWLEIIWEVLELSKELCPMKELQIEIRKGEKGRSRVWIILLTIKYESLCLRRILIFLFYSHLILKKPWVPPNRTCFHPFPKTFSLLILTSVILLPHSNYSGNFCMTMLA